MTWIPGGNEAFKDSDIDMFIYGLNQEEANKKLKEIYFIVQSNTQASSEIMRTKNAITILGQYPFRHVQIILRLYKSPAEILMGFDIDSCAGKWIFEFSLDVDESTTFFFLNLLEFQNLSLDLTGNKNVFLLHSNWDVEGISSSNFFIIMNGLNGNNNNWIEKCSFNTKIVVFLNNEISSLENQRFSIILSLWFSVIFICVFTLSFGFPAKIHPKKMQMNQKMTKW